MYKFYSRACRRNVSASWIIAPELLAFPLEELLDRITPATRAVFISNPNNPTGTGTSLAASEKILKKASARGCTRRRGILRIQRSNGSAAASPNIRICSSAGRFQKCTAWPPCAADVCFRRPRTWRFVEKAQSPYSVNTLAAMAARIAVQDRKYVDEYVIEVLAARELLYVGFERLEHFVSSRARRTSCCSTPEPAPSRFATSCASAAFSSATAATSFPGCVRVTVGTRDQIATFPRPNWRRSGDDRLLT